MAMRNAHKEIKRTEAEGSPSEGEALLHHRLYIKNAVQRGLDNYHEKVHPAQFHRPSLSRLLWRDDLLLPRSVATFGTNSNIMPTDFPKFQRKSFDWLILLKHKH